MAEIKILIEGYAREEKGTEFTSSTTTLIRENGLNIIVDPGTNRNLLLKSLKKENLFTSDIDFVILTHHHLDHTLLAGIFENSKIISASNIYSWNSKIEDYNGTIPGTRIKIIKTPGHDYSQCSVLVETRENGKVVIASDVFWWWDNEEEKTDKETLIGREDPYAINKKELMESRKKILNIADYIIPGHGKMFKVER